MVPVKKTLCSKAWTDLNIDFSKRKLRHCCKTIFEPFPDKLTFDFFNKSTKIQERRNDLLSGIEHSDCNHCWISYEKTGTAYRDFENRWTKMSDLRYDVRFIEIMLDNICDMSCIYCDSDFSSKIAAEKKLKQPLIQPIDDDLDVFIAWLTDLLQSQSSSCTLSFLGGEITYSKNFFKFITRLLDATALHEKEIMISFLTNGNSDKERLQKMLDLLDTLPKKWSVNICMSNEATGKASELVRWGVSWDKFKYNLEQYIQHPRVKFLCLSPTPCLFTIPDMLTYFEWTFNKVKEYNKKLSIAGNWIVYPTEIDVARCSVDKKTYVKKTKQLCIDNKDIFAFETEFNRTLKWLDLLEERIGTIPLDQDALNKFLDQKAKEKNDNIYLLRNYL